MVLPNESAYGSAQLDLGLIRKYSVAGPRYTSYPTAPQWSTAVSGDTYAAALQSFGRNDKTLSLYHGEGRSLGIPMRFSCAAMALALSLSSTNHRKI